MTTKEEEARPWKTEPDRAEFRHHGFVCLIKRGPMGQWCGYVALPPGHPLHGKSYDDCDSRFDVHGGLTYAGKCDLDIGICHEPEPGESDDVWWLGFDCGHCFDIIPEMAEQYDIHLIPGQVYRDQAYVTAETQSLAEQLAVAATD